MTFTYLKKNKDRPPQITEGEQESKCWAGVVTARALHTEFVSWALPLPATNSALWVVGFVFFFSLNNPKIREQCLIVKSWQGWLVHRQFPQKGSPHLPAYCSPKLQSSLVRPEEEELQHVSTPRRNVEIIPETG